MKYLSLLLLLFISNSLVAQEFHPFINGGEKVTADDQIAKSTVMLETEAQYCSATIIGKGLLLTAAHCLTPGSDWMQIHFKGLEGNLSRPVSKALRHENYQDLGETTLNDVALVFFDGDLPSGFEGVPILPPEKSLTIGEELLLAGYGSGSPQGSLAKIKLTLSAFLDQQRLLQFNQTPQHGICHGDSGGPAYKMIDGQLYLAGVASYTYEIDCSGYSVYTAATPFDSWIKQKQLK